MKVGVYNKVIDEITIKRGIPLVFILIVILMCMSGQASNLYKNTFKEYYV